MLEVETPVYDNGGQHTFSIWEGLTLQHKHTVCLELGSTWLMQHLLYCCTIRCFVFFFFLILFQSWTLTAEPQRRIQAMEMRYYHKILSISYKDHVTNQEVRAKIQQAIGPHEDLLTIVKRRKLQWYGHVSHSSGLAKTILQGTVKKGKKTRRTKKQVGRQHQGMDRPGVRQVLEGSGEQGKMEETGCEFICGAPTTLMVKRQMR